ncbi:calponin homology domain-containing protein [Kockovaella imperatae]|uniref:Calponin homology domain-containing protein n=1 Tax=Kockovaella imperatae TaxID=4999 RepID=A0A1Y1U7Y0_9TREE|nr:calponin homology domain-containing protein [Kockovaella imperatae]ORX34112.1 calponin homology domain-containing protein [Kockovaella imperatae]
MAWPSSPAEIERRGSHRVNTSMSAPSTPTRAAHGRNKSIGFGVGFGNANGGSIAASPGGPGLGPSTGSLGQFGSVPMSPGASGWSMGMENGWADIQARTFCRWLNTKLEGQKLEPMTDLVKDFSSGVKLIQLLEIMSETSLGRYNKKPVMRVQKAENASKALNFIRERGVKLTNIGGLWGYLNLANVCTQGPEDIVDGNLKLILGMIWTLILRFTIATITEEGMTAKDGLLLWCQRKTKNYDGVEVKDFKGSFSDGLALCALIHRHRPDLLDWHALNKSDRRGNTELAFRVAEQSLGIPRLLEVKDLCEVDVPDERSVMTYVAEFFHKFSSEDKMETGTRRVEKFAELMQGIWTSKNDFERRMAALLATLDITESSWLASSSAASYPEAMAHLSEFTEYKRTTKRAWVKERQELGALYSNIRTKLKTYALRSWEPREGLTLEDLERRWAAFLQAEGTRSRAINARIREIKESLRKEFARVAEDFVHQLQRIEQAIGALQGALADQRQTLQRLSDAIPTLRAHLMTDVAAVNEACLEAKVEENDYTVLTFDDLEFELELVEAGIKKKISFVDNQSVSATHTNLTPAKLEEFEATFKHFDKDDTNTLQLWEMHSALASLGIVYGDDEIEILYSQLEADFGAVTYEAWLALLVDITRDDSSSRDQLHEAFRGMARDKPYVTELDFIHSNLPSDRIKFLQEVMPESKEVDAEAGESTCYDFHAFLEMTFAR